MSEDDLDPPNESPTSKDEWSDSYPIDNPPFDPEHPPFGWRRVIPDDPVEPPRWVRPEPLMLGSQSAVEPFTSVREPVGSRATHPVTGQTLRAWLTICLTVAVIVVVLTAMIMRLPPGDFAQYVSPITALAGLALGYWFGTEKKN
jgi:hypothetical protein